MPVRATKRGAERTPFAPDASSDVLICGASLRGADRRARAARDAARACWCSTATRSGSGRPPRAPPPPNGCATSGLEASIRQTFDSLLVHTPRRDARAGRSRGRSRRSTTASCAALLWEQCGDADVRDREGRTGATGSVVPHRPRRRARAPLIVDALGWRRVLGPGDERPAARGARCRAGWRCTRPAAAPTSSCGSTRATSPPATAGRSRRATRCASASARSTRTIHVKQPTAAAGRGRRPPTPDGYQGNWIPHRLRPATEDGVFFAGDSRRPLPAADRRGHPHGASTSGSPAAASCARCSTGRQTRARRRWRATARFSAAHRWKFECDVRAPSSRSATCTAARWTGSPAFFVAPARRPTGRSAHYLGIAPPEFALPAPPVAAAVARRRRRRRLAFAPLSLRRTSNAALTGEWAGVRVWSGRRWPSARASRGR